MIEDQSQGSTESEETYDRISRGGAKETTVTKTSRTLSNTLSVSVPFKH